MQSTFYLCNTMNIFSPSIIFASQHTTLTTIKIHMIHSNRPIRLPSSIPTNETPKPHRIPRSTPTKDNEAHVRIKSGKGGDGKDEFAAIA